MKSKSALLPACLLLVFSLFSVRSFAEEETGQAPSLVFPAPKYEFEEVLEGDEVLHDFVIRNRGATVLEVLRVKPG